MVMPGTFPRTIVSALNPRRYTDSFTEIYMTVWFEELNGPVEFCATPFDCERHGVYLWLTAMRGDYGPIEVVPGRDPWMRLIEENKKILESGVVELPRLLEYHPGGEGA